MTQFNSQSTNELLDFRELELEDGWDSDSPIGSLPGTPKEQKKSEAANVTPELYTAELNTSTQDTLPEPVISNTDNTTNNPLFTEIGAKREVNFFLNTDEAENHLTTSAELTTEIEPNSGARKSSEAFYADIIDIESQITQSKNRYLTETANEAVEEPEYASEDTPNFLKKLQAHWKWLVIGIVALFVVATAVTVPTVLLLGKDEPIVLPEGESHWIQCPFRNGVEEEREKECSDKKCTWRQSRPPWPSCYMTAEKTQYKVAQVWLSKKQLLLHLQRSENDINLFGKPHTDITIQLDCTHTYRLRVKVSAGRIQPDPATWTVKNGNNKHDCESDEYIVQTSTTSGQDFELALERKLTATNIWNSSLGGLLVEESFLQVTNLLPTSFIYGMAENWHGPSLLRELDLLTWPLFSRSAVEGSTKQDNRVNLNSVHPFYINLESNGTANGVLFKTSYPSEYILLKAPGIVFRTTEEKLEYDIFLGRNPKHVSELLHEVIGEPQLPPMWALGFHIAPNRFPDQLIDTFRKANIPLDSVHLSPSLWKNEMVFQSNQIKSSTYFKYIEENEDLNWVFTVTPTVHANEDYRAYTEGLRSNAFVRWPQDKSGTPGNIMFGNRTENFPVAFFDLTNDAGADLWKDLLRSVRSTDFNYTGIFVSENEPFNFGTNQNHTPNSLNCSQTSLDHLAYSTAAAWRHGPGARLSDGTLCMVGQHAAGKDKSKTHLEFHNSYGMDMALKSNEACSESERCFVMSHSSAYLFENSAPIGTICKVLGYSDNSWEGMKRSLTSVLEFNLMGMPLVAVDICGDTEAMDLDLCGRWIQLSSFFPVARAKFSMTNDYGTSESILHPRLREDWTKTYLGLRLSLLAYTYSALHRSQKNGEPLLRPLFYEYPNDIKAKEIDTQFMYGSSIMVAPVLDEHSHKNEGFQVYFPDDNWYRLKHHSGEKMPYAPGNKYIPGIDFIPIFVRAGHIIPLHHVDDASNVESALNSPITLRVFPKDGEAKGFLYVDDGRLDSDKTDNFFHFEFNQCVFSITRDKIFKEPFPRLLEITHIEIYDWEMYDEKLLTARKNHRAPPHQSEPSKQDFTCEPAHDHKILILKTSVNLTANVENNLWTLDWSQDKVCSHLRSETGCTYVRHYYFQDNT